MSAAGRHAGCARPAQRRRRGAPSAGVATGQARHVDGDANRHRPNSTRQRRMRTIDPGDARRAGASQAPCAGGSPGRSGRAQPRCGAGAKGGLGQPGNTSSARVRSGCLRQFTEALGRNSGVITGGCPSWPKLQFRSRLAASTCSARPAVPHAQGGSPPGQPVRGEHVAKSRTWRLRR